MRSRSVFLSQGLTVAVVDVPSDRQEGRGLIGFRQSPAHMQDIAAVMLPPSAGQRARVAGRHSLIPRDRVDSRHPDHELDQDHQVA